MKNTFIKALAISTALGSIVAGNVSAGEGPMSQQQFCAIINDYRADYEAAQSSNNEIKINNVSKQRSDDLDALMPNGQFNDWEVTFLKATSSSTGGANVCLFVPACNVILQTGSLKENMAERSDYSVEYNSREYRAVSSLGLNDEALLSGKLTKIAKYQNGAAEYSYAKEALSDETMKLSSNCELDLKSSLLENKKLKASMENLTGSVSGPQFFFFELEYIAPIK